MSDVDELKVMLVDFYNEQRRQEHVELLNDPERLERFRRYNWFTEEYPEPIAHFDEIGWGELVYEIYDVELNGFKFKSLDSHGGEGQGDHMHWVFSITDPEGNVTYWKKDGYWVSHDGSYWDDYELYKVTPKQRTVTYYD